VIRLQMPHRRWPVAVVSLLAILLVSAACGGDDGDTATPTKAANTAAASPTKSEAATQAATTAASPTTAATATTGPAAAALLKVGTTTKGNVLTDNAGLSLYTFDNDTTAGKSSCNGSCTNNWPPVTTTAAAAPSGITGASGAFSILTRDDGAKQIAYNGKPLYRWAADKAPGDTGGDGVGSVWHLAKP